MSYRYIGNKTKLLEIILNKISQITPEGSTVVDLMSGTASVAEALRVSGYNVICCDLMTYSNMHGKVRLLANKDPAFKKLKLGRYEDVLNYLNSLESIDGHFTKEYSPSGVPVNSQKPRMYFTVQNAMKIDAINTQINKWTRKNLLSDLEIAFLRHSFVLAVNRIANIAGTYGHYRSSWNKSSLEPIQLRKAEYQTGYSTKHVILQGSAENLAHKISADLCYIDPPYMKRQYAANYHIIETIARGDSPEAIGESGLRPWRDQYSNFCSKLNIRNSFDKIFTDMDCKKFLISYSEDGLLKKEELIDLFSKYGKVSFEEINYQRFKSNNSPLKKVLKEYLFYITK